MKLLRSILRGLKYGAKLVVGSIAVVVIFWGIAYRFILGFTPEWLDLATAGAVGVAMLVAWAIGRNQKFDYSKRVNHPPGQAPSKE